MTDDDSKEITDIIFPFIKKYPLEEVIEVIKDSYEIFDPKINPEIRIRNKGNSGETES